MKDKSKRVEKKGWNWAAVPAEVILSDKLTHSDVRVYAYVLWRAGNKGNAWPNAKTVAHDLGMSEPSVLRSFKNLISENWIKRLRRFGKSSITLIFENQEECRTYHQRYDESITSDMFDISPVIRLNESHINESKRTNGGEKSSRQRNPLFDAIVSVCGIDPSIKGNGATVGKVVKELESANPPYTADEVLEYGRRISWMKNKPSVWKLKQEIGTVRQQTEIHPGTPPPDSILAEDIKPGQFSPRL